jgi:ubiquitin carboxyl-terminal hydrolase 4/11
MWQKQMLEGSIWYVLSMQWFNKWEKYMNVEIGSEYPGKVDNSDILINLSQENKYLVEKRTEFTWQNTYFQRDIAENIDYLLVDKNIWEFFVGIYGCNPDQVI